MSSLGSQQPLKDIEDSLAGEAVDSEARPSQTGREQRLEDIKGATYETRLSQTQRPLTGREKRLKDIEDALSGRPAASETRPSQNPTPLTGREKRLKDIENALSGRPVASETYPSQTPRPLTGREKRLKDIEDALSGRPVASETRSSQTPRPLTRRGQPLNDTKNILPVSEMTQEYSLSVPSTLKRSSYSITPQTSPTAKRRRLLPESPVSSRMLLSPDSSPRSAVSSLATICVMGTPETVSSSSPSPDPVITVLPEEVCCIYY